MHYYMFRKLAGVLVTPPARLRHQLNPFKGESNVLNRHNHTIQMATANQKSISSRLKAAREKLSITQSEAARQWGVSVQAVQLWEQERRQPRGLYLEKIEGILAKIEAGKAL